MTPPDAATLTAFLKQLASAYKDAQVSAPTDDPAADPVEHLLWSLLLWESTPTKAREAYKRFTDAATDLNELRVLLTSEYEDLLGPRYPLVTERAARIKMALNAVYNDQHDVTLAHLQKAQKREARKYLEALEGVPHFVAARVTAVSLGGHAIPVDEKLRDLLAGAGITEKKVAPPALAGSLERAIKATDSLAVIAHLEAWAADPSPKITPKPKKTSRKKNTAKKSTTKKKTTKKSTRKKS